MEIERIIMQAVDAGASDIFIIAGQPISYKCRRDIRTFSGEIMSPCDAAKAVDALYSIARRNPDRYEKSGDDDFALTLDGRRFRVSALKQRGEHAAVIRPVSSEIPDYREIGIPECVMQTARLQKGLVLVTGPAGSGKSTTLACVMDKVNHEYEKHIITIEDPIEYI